MYIEGRIVYREYLDKENNKKYVTEIVANEVIGLDSKKQGEETEKERVDREFPDVPEPEKSKEEVAVDDIPF
jgi:single-strand DNA-binding protein